MKTRPDKGFTLVELLIVIGVISVLSAIVVITLNPAELLKQSRDSVRLSDMANLNKALGVYQTGGGTLMGQANTVYISVPDSMSGCQTLGLPSLPAGWSYSCASALNYSKAGGTGWIPIDFTQNPSGQILSQLPIDPVNATSSGNYYRYVTGGGRWELKAELESKKHTSKSVEDGGVSGSVYEIGSNLTLAPNVFPENWIKVSGNPAYGTADFWVMKYEAKCIGTTSALGLTAPNTVSQTYSNTTTPCTSANGRYVASAPSGYSIASISHDTAKTYCQSLGVGFHLITNDEWMTIARDAEQVASNWTSGSVGSGNLFGGHMDNSPNLAQVASMNDADGYYNTGNSAPSNQRRTLVLSNGEVIWDLSGNLWEHVMRDTSDTLTSQLNQPDTAISDGQWKTSEFTALTSYGNMSYDMIRPSNSSWNSTYGVGRIHHCDGCTNAIDQNVFLRGNRWSDSVAGVYGLYLNWAAGQTDNSVGFRCAR